MWLSSSAKADDPVAAGGGRPYKSHDRRVGGYWMPAFAGMTAEKQSIAAAQPGHDGATAVA
jgi:hypothetical protein